MQNRITPKIRNLLIIFLVILINSCVPIEKLKYFNDIDELQEPIVNPKKQKLIMPYDYLYIKVFSIDDKTNMVFNSASNLPPSSASTLSGYLVDESGDIDYPFVGKINVSGITPAEASKKLETALSEYVSNAAITVNFLDNNVTLLGEVQRQGIYPFTQDKLNIYEALALGGGISQYGNRKNVILVRQEGDKIMHYRLNLSDSKIAGKDFYYIQANDVIVVEPLKSSSWFTFNSSTFQTLLVSVTSIFSILIFAKNIKLF